jgi:hypothetical protein
MVGADKVSFSFISLGKNPRGGGRGSVPSGFRGVWAGLDGVRLPAGFNRTGLSIRPGSKPCQCGTTGFGRD